MEPGRTVKQGHIISRSSPHERTTCLPLRDAPAETLWDRRLSPDLTIALSPWRAPLLQSPVLIAGDSDIMAVTGPVGG